MEGISIFSGKNPSKIGTRNISIARRITTEKRITEIGYMVADLILSFSVFAFAFDWLVWIKFHLDYHLLHQL